MIILDDGTISENADHNNIRLDVNGGVVTKFADNLETYQLDDKQAGVLRDMMTGTGDFLGLDMHNVLKHVPAPLVVDLAAGITAGKVSHDEFMDVVRTFKEDYKIKGEYVGFRSAGIANTGGAFSESREDLVPLMKELEEIRAKRVASGVDELTKAEQLVENVVDPTSVQEIRFR